MIRTLSLAGQVWENPARFRILKVPQSWGIGGHCREFETSQKRFPIKKLRSLFAKEAYMTAVGTSHIFNREHLISIAASNQFTIQQQ